MLGESLVVKLGTFWALGVRSCIMFEGEIVDVVSGYMDDENMEQ